MKKEATNSKSALKFSEMKVVIIEDEAIAASKLKSSIARADPNVSVLAIVDSVSRAKDWFACNRMPDLIFSDIKLGDGESFEIFESLDEMAPIVFCTAFDTYALNAFKSNGIDYIVKPYSDDRIINALQKYRNLVSREPTEQRLQEVLELLSLERESKSSSILIHHKDRIIPFPLSEIVMFYLSDQASYVLTKDLKDYRIRKKLDDCEELAGQRFFRISRQELINRDYIVDVSQYFGRKLAVRLSVPLGRTLTVSRPKVQVFLRWLTI